MNSKKILKILIWVFFLVNILLFSINYYYYRDSGQLSAERRSRLVGILAKNNIELDCELPKIRQMKMLSLKKADDREKELVDRIFKDKLREFTYNEGEHRHSDGNETLIFNKQAEYGRVFYNADKPSYRLGKTSIENLIKDFTADFSVDNEMYEVVQKAKTPEAKIFFLNEVYEGYNIFSNEIVLSIDDEGISEARAIRYTPLKFVKNSLELISVDEILYKFMYENKFDEKVKIVDISIGYYFDADLLGISYSFLAAPTYRVLLSDGNKYYINAISGEIIN